MERPECLRQISIPVFILVIMFAMSSWIDIFGIFVELPIFVNKLPEGWALPSQMGMASFAANIAPVLFLIAVKLSPRKIKEWPFIAIIIGVGCTMCLSLVFLWDKTAHVAGTKRSIGLLGTVCVLSVVDTTSSVVYIPYMAKFKTQYLTAYFIGEAMGSFIPGLLGLAQGVENEPVCLNSTFVLFNETDDNITGWKIKEVYATPLFSVEVFLMGLFGILVLSGISFLCLELTPFCRKEYSKINRGSNNETVVKGNKVMMPLRAEDGSNDETFLPTLSNNEIKISSQTISSRKCIYVLILCGSLSIFNYGILPSTATYSVIPYGIFYFYYLCLSTM